jgi:hypothetical protein
MNSPVEKIYGSFLTVELILLRVQILHPELGIDGSIFAHRAEIETHDKLIISMV